MEKNYTKFNKLKNFYGIKELKGLERISKDALVYAPNGVMKTSFADGMKNVTFNEPIIDVFEKNLGEYDIEQNTKKFTESSNDGSLQCIVFSGKYLKTDVFSNPALASMAMSGSLKDAYSKEKAELENIRDEFDRICSLSIKGGKKKIPNCWESISDIVGGETIDEVIDNILSIDKNESQEFQELSFNAVCNSKISDLYGNQNFIEKLSLYSDIVNKKMNEDIFNSGFTYFGLVELRDTMKTVHYFEARHEIKIADSIIKDLESLDSFIGYQKDFLFASDDVQQAFSDVKTMLDTNAQTRAFSKLLSTKFDILANNNDIKGKQHKLIRSKVIGIEDTLLDLKRRQLKADASLKNILKKAKEENSTWKQAKDIFNFRFSLNRTDLDLQYEIVDGYPVPRIIQIDKITKQRLNNSMVERFSEGEKRALYILNLLFEIESRKLEWHDGMLLILDDVADSFDYQNKYAICKYIQELYADPQFHVITLTHNFDFYRCCSYFLSKISVSGCFAQKHRNNVTLKSGISKDFLSLSFNSGWKGCLGGLKNSNFENIILFFAILPIIRNEYEIEESTSGKNYALMCDLLHRRRDVHKNNLAIYKPIFDEKISKTLDPVYYSLSYNELIKKCYDKLEGTTSIDEFKISSKMACAVLLRIFYEEFILLKSKNEKIVLDSKANEKIDNLYSKLKTEGKLSNDEIIHCEFASIICNPYVHVNSFMYEQLIDNPADKLVEHMKYFAIESGIFKVDI